MNNGDLIDLLMDRDTARLLQKYRNEKQIAELLDYANVHKIRPNILQKLVENAEDGQEYICDLQHKFFLQQKQRVEAQLRTVEMIKEHLQPNEYVWIKGIPLSKVVYGIESYRDVGDIDILVVSDKITEVLSKLLDSGFTLLGVSDISVMKRYSKNYHEIQLKGPFDEYVELKEVSGEMDVFINEHIAVDFLAAENTQQIILKSNFYTTSTLVFSLLHLLLTAVSNSSTWFFLHDIGLRDMYEIYLLAKNKSIDYDRLRWYTDRYGISGVVATMMRRINSTFDEVFSAETVALFANFTDTKHIVSSLYERYWAIYNHPISAELNSQESRRTLYFDALRKLYYESFDCPEINVLDENIMSYLLSYDEHDICLDLLINEFYFKSGNYVLIRLFSNKQEYVERYGEFFLALIKLGNSDPDTVMSRVPMESGKLYEVKMDQWMKVGDKIKIRCRIPTYFLDLTYRKVCLNIQLFMPNPHDTEDYRITELCPQKNTLCLLHTCHF